MCLMLLRSSLQLDGEMDDEDFLLWLGGGARVTDGAFSFFYNRKTS